METRHVLIIIFILLLQVGQFTKAKSGFILFVDHDCNEMFCQVNNLYTVGTDNLLRERNNERTTCRGGPRHKPFGF